MDFARFTNNELINTRKVFLISLGSVLNAPFTDKLWVLERRRVRELCIRKVLAGVDTEIARRTYW
jgi:hypothetical protein